MNRIRDFLIYLEKDHLLIQVNSILERKEELEPFFNLGTVMQKKFNRH